MNFPQLKAKVCCLATNLINLTAAVSALTLRVAALEEGGGTPPPDPDPIPTSGEFIDGPPVSSLTDTRGLVGDWSFNPDISGGTMYQKVSILPHAWVSWTVAVA
jgi:hypothetical protein